MAIQYILSLLSYLSDFDAPSLLLKYQDKTILTDKETKFLIKNLQKSLDTRSSLKAANYLYAGLILDESHFLPILQEKGLLRLSRYSYAENTLKNTIATLIKPGIGLSANVSEYLQSLSHLYYIATSIRKEYDSIKSWLSLEREVGIKSALASLDFLFLRHMAGFRIGDKNETSRDPLFFIVEELAEGFSSILALYGNEFGQIRGNREINPDRTSNGFYYEMLVSGAHLAAFREWEFQVDRMGYRFSRKEGTKEFVLSPPSTEFLRAVDLGYIRSFSHHVIEPMEWDDERDHSIVELVRKTALMLKEKGYIVLEEKPFERYLFRFPEPILKALLGYNGLFREERVLCLLTCQDLLTPFEQLMDFNIGNGLTFRDVFFLSRMMRFLCLIFSEILSPEADTRPELVFQSIIPVFQRDQLIELISLAVGKEKAEVAIDLLMADIKGHIDIQYKPLLPAGKTILFPTSIFASSNIYRNLLKVSGMRLYSDGTDDPLEKSLFKVFEASGAFPKTRVSYTWNNEEGEVDVLVLMDNLLFVFECKNSLLPTGPHELMTSLNYLYKAADQLDLFKRNFSDAAFREWLEKDKGLLIDSETHLVTGIIISNRMLLGFRVNGHPVRGNYELEHFVKEGTIRMANEERCFWLGQSFTGQDLRRFLEEDITYQHAWSAMKSVVFRYLLDGCTIDVERMTLDMIAAADNLGFKQTKEILLERKNNQDDTSI